MTNIVNLPVKYTAPKTPKVLTPADEAKAEVINVMVDKWEVKAALFITSHPVIEKADGSKGELERLKECAGWFKQAYNSVVDFCGDNTADKVLKRAFKSSASALDIEFRKDVVNTFNKIQTK